MMKSENSFEKSLQKTFLKFNDECFNLLKTSKLALKNVLTKREDATTKAIIKAWTIFSKGHQSSPTRTNNNVSNHVRTNLEHTKYIGIIGKPVYNNQFRKKCTIRKHKFDQYINVESILLLIRIVLELILTISTFIFLLYILIVLHKSSQAFVSRNTQDLIFPFMYNLRRISIPIVHSFPWITRMYEESCLIPNPVYFQAQSYDCSSCHSIKQIIDLTNLVNFTSQQLHSAIPFVVKENSKIDVNTIEELYYDHLKYKKDVFIQSNVPKVTSLSDVFPISRTKIFQEHKDAHITWKNDRASHTRILRKYFTKPEFIPVKTEVSIQRFLFIDNSESPAYSLPFTEFANVYVKQTSGTRRYVLIPSNSCRSICRPVSVVLTEGDVLFYNWLYWNPESVALSHVNSHTQNFVSVSYVGSFY